MGELKSVHGLKSGQVHFVLQLDQPNPPMSFYKLTYSSLGFLGIGSRSSPFIEFLAKKTIRSLLTLYPFDYIITYPYHILLTLLPCHVAIPASLVTIFDGELTNTNYITEKTKNYYYVFYF